VAVPVVPTIEAQGVRAVQVLHPGRQALSRRLDDEVVVRTHQAEGVAVPGVAIDNQREQREEVPSVVVVQVDEPPEDRSGGDVEDPVRQVATANARHEADRSADASGHTIVWMTRHELGTNAMSNTGVFGGQAPGPGRCRRGWAG
jgi:hypothetical protein